MAENKKSFLLYCDLKFTIDQLPDDKAGKLFKHILAYVNDEDPETDDLIINIAFEPIKRQLKRDLKKYESIREKRAEAGRKGGKAKGSKRKQNEAKESDIDKDIVIDKDKVIDKDTSLEKKQRFNFTKSLIEEGFKKELISDWLKVRSKKKASNTKTAFNNFVAEIDKALKNNPSYDKNAILEFCIVNDWKGFKAEWINNINVENLNDDELQNEIDRELKEGR